jgi:hypothetical protein
VAGALTSVAIAAIIARTLRRLLPANGSLTELLALSCTLALCSAIYAPIEARLPALFWPAPPRDALPRPMPQPAASACDQAPPADPAMRRDWDTECR